MRKRTVLFCNIIMLLALLAVPGISADVVLLWPDADIPADLTRLRTEQVAAQSGEKIKIELFNKSRTAFILGVPSLDTGYRPECSKGIEYRLYEIQDVPVPGKIKAEYPDLLMPLRETRQLQNSKQGGEYTWFWLEIFCRPEPLAGEDSLVISAPDEKQRAVQIQIHRKTAAPVPAPVHLIFNEYGPDYLDGFTGSAKEKAEFELAVFRQCRAEHGILMPLPYKSQRGTPRPGMAPEIEWIGRDSLKLDWESFDRRFSPLLGGSAFPDGQPLEEFYLPFNPEWPAPFHLYWENRPLYEKIWEITAREFIRHFRQKGWTQTHYQIYLNQKPGKRNRIPWHLDEPRGRKDLEALAYFEKLTHRVFQDAEINFKFRVDISHWYCDKHRGHAQKDFELNGGPNLLKNVDLWCVSWHSLSGRRAAERAVDLTATDKTVWLYGKTPLITTPGTAVFKDLYSTWMNGWGGFLFWASFTDKIGEDDGFDFGWYQIPGEGTMRIAPSLRVKRLGSAVDDLIHLLRLSQGASNGMALTRKMVAEYLSGDFAARSKWYRAEKIK
ncbi:MAG: hypothetical protein Kow0037_12610 [Calditrichia bacterium]